MLLKNGEYFAFPVDQNDPEFSLTVESHEEHANAQRQSLAVKPEQAETNELDELKSQVKGGIAAIKKGGWKSALSLAKKAAEKALDDQPQQAAVEDAPDPMDPTTAFGFDETANVHYKLVKSLKDKEKNLDYYEFRSDRGYGVLINKGDDVFQEISFIYPSHEYAEKHYPNQHVGRSVPDWRREDDQLHRMRVYYLSSDKHKAQQAAQSANLKQDIADYFDVDLNSTRANQATLFSAPNLDLDAKTGELSMNFIRAWFLPMHTKLGRQIQYNWDALRIKIIGNDEVIYRRVCWSRNSGRELIASQENWFELMGSGYFGELSAGQYQLQVDIYDTTLMVYPFEVIELNTTDTRSKFERYFALKTPADDWVKIRQNVDSFELDIHLPILRHLEPLAKEESFELACRVEQNGKAWPDYKMDYFASSNMKQEHTVLNDAKWWQTPRAYQIPFADRAEIQGRQAAEDGTYQILFELGENKQPFETIDIEMKNGALQGTSSHPHLPLADFAFPEEHQGVWLPLHKG